MNKTDDDTDAYLWAINTITRAMKGPGGSPGPAVAEGTVGIIKYLCCLVHPRTRKRIKIRLTEDQMEMFDNFSGPTANEIDLFKMLYPAQALEIEGIVPFSPLVRTEEALGKILEEAKEKRRSKLSTLWDDMKNSGI